MTVKELKKGDYFKRNANSKSVLVKGDYIRSEKKYSCYYFDDVNKEIFLKGDKEIFIDFEF